jgi:hypothetical protein
MHFTPAKRVGCLPGSGHGFERNLAKLSVARFGKGQYRRH